jgi:hypothetical protein
MTVILGTRHAACAALLALACPAQNSTAKVRPAPGPLAARAGSAVEWRASLAEALAESARTKKPVFWYVPSVVGSPMDRKPEIDRYLMAGPFSVPALVALLNEHCVPVREPASRASQRQHRLRPHDFIEPGFLVLDDDGRELTRSHEVTTLHPRWWLLRLCDALGLALPEEDRPAALRAAAADVGQRRYAEAAAGLRAFLATGDAGPHEMAARLLLGCALLRSGRQKAARDLWGQAAAAHPDHPLAWKMAAELEGHGPFVHGFEVLRDVPDEVLRGAVESSRAKPGSYGREALAARSLEFLIDVQDEDGGYRDSTYDFGGTDSLPNVHVAVAAIVGCALLEHRGSAPEEVAPAVAATLERVVRHCFEEDHTNPDDRDEILWAHAYRLRFASRWCALRPAEAERMAPHCRRLIGALAGLQAETGAWFHEYVNPFATAITLAALRDAEEQGFAVPPEVVERGVRSLLRCRAESGAFTYGQVESGPARAQVPSAACRMPVCELALARLARADAGALQRAVAAGLEHHESLAKVRKYDDHADRHGHGGFFFWFDMLGRTEAIAQLEPGEARRDAARRQLALVLEVPELDGCFVDSHELGRAYGTAMALLCLAALPRE